MIVTLVLVLARFVLTHCYIACPSVTACPAGSAKPSIRQCQSFSASAKSVPSQCQSVQCQSVVTTYRHSYGHIFCSSLCQHPLKFVCCMRLMKISQSFHRRLTKLIQVSNTIGLCFHREPFSWNYQLRLQHFQSSTKSVANLVMHMPFFNMVHFMSINHILHG